MWAAAEPWRDVVVPSARGDRGSDATLLRVKGGNVMTTLYVSEIRERLQELGKRVREMGVYL